MDSALLIVFILAGVLVGILIALALILISRTNHSLKGQYDERQKLMKGKAFESAFYTGLGYLLLIYLLDLGHFRFPVQTGLVALIGGTLSLTVYVTQAVFTDAYIGLNEKYGRTMLIFIVCAFLNIFPAVSNYVNGTYVKNGVLSNTFGNVIILFMILYVMIIMTIKHLLSDREGSDEES